MNGCRERSKNALESKRRARSATTRIKWRHEFFGVSTLRRTIPRESISHCRFPIHLVGVTGTVTIDVSENCDHKVTLFGDVWNHVIQRRILHDVQRRDAFAAEIPAEFEGGDHRRLLRLQRRVHRHPGGLSRWAFFNRELRSVVWCAKRWLRPVASRKLQPAGSLILLLFSVTRNYIPKDGIYLQDLWSFYDFTLIWQIINILYRKKLLLLNLRLIGDAKTNISCEMLKKIKFRILIF